MALHPLRLLASVADDEQIKALTTAHPACHNEEDGETSSSEHVHASVTEHAVFPSEGSKSVVIAKRKRSRATAQPVAPDVLQDRARQQRSSPRRSSQRTTGVRSSEGMDSFTSFASMYREQLRFADSDEAEAVFGIVSLTQAKPSAPPLRARGAAGQAGKLPKATAQHAKPSHPAPAGRHHTAAAQAAPRAAAGATKRARRSREPSAPCGSEGSTDSSTKSLPIAPDAEGPANAALPALGAPMPPPALLPPPAALPLPSPALVGAAPTARPCMPSWGPPPFGMYGGVPMYGMPPPMMFPYPPFMAPWGMPPLTAAAPAMSPGSPAHAFVGPAGMPPGWLPGMAPWAAPTPWMAPPLAGAMAAHGHGDSGAQRPVLGNPVLRPAVMGLPVFGPFDPTPAVSGLAATPGAPRPAGTMSAPPAAAVHTPSSGCPPAAPLCATHPPLSWAAACMACASSQPAAGGTCSPPAAARSGAAAPAPAPSPRSRSPAAVSTPRAPQHIPSEHSFPSVAVPPPPPAAAMAAAPLV